MGYTLVKAVVLGRTIGGQWVEKDISTIPINILYNQYYKVYVELSNPSLINNIYVDMDTLKSAYSSFTGVMTDLLADIGNATLVTVAELPNTTIKYVKFSDAFRSMYKVNLTNIGQVLPVNYPNTLRNDLVVTRPNFDTDMSLINSHCLVTVNGYIHDTLTSDNKLYVKDGGKTMRKARNNSLGIMSFLDISEVHKIKLTDAKIIKDGPTDLYDHLYLDVGTSLTNKSYFLVLGGYLVMPEDNILWAFNDTTLTLNLDMLPYIERIYESDVVMDLSELAITRDPQHPEVMDINQLKSDAFIRSYLKLNNTFIVILDVNHLTYNKIYLRHSNMPGMFTAYQDPSYPLIVNYGRVAEYWKTYEDNQWSVTVNDSFLREYVIDFRVTPNLELVNNHLIPDRQNKHSRGFLLEIGGYNM